MTNAVADREDLLECIRENRMCQRRPISPEVEFKIRKGRLGVGRDIGCELLDVADHGLGLRISEEVQVGRELTIELIFLGATKRLRLIGQVRWCEPLDNGTFRVGTW